MWEVKTRQLGRKRAGGITKGHKRPVGAAWPTPTFLPDEQEVGGQQKVGGRRWQKVGRLGSSELPWGSGWGDGRMSGGRFRLEGAVFPESRSHPGREDGGENRKSKGGGTKGRTDQCERSSLHRGRE